MPTPVQAFGAARIAVGTISWLSPTASSRVFGLDPRSRQPIVSQLFGSRDLALGLLTATATGPSLRQVLTVGAAIDAADVVASLRQIRAGTLSTQAIVTVAVGAASFAAFGLAALRALPADLPAPPPTTPR